MPKRREGSIILHLGARSRGLRGFRYGDRSHRQQASSCVADNLLFATLLVNLAAVLLSRSRLQLTCSTLSLTR
jgi:hypothetical protein